MSWETEFEEYYTDEVKRRAYAGQDGYGQPTFGAETTMLCRVVYKPELLRQQGSGQASGTTREVVSRARVFSKGIVGWGLRDEITLPDGSQPKILQVVTYPDETGPHHEVVFV